LLKWKKIGTNIFAIYVDWQSNRLPTGREFNLSDVAVIKDQIPEITHLSPVNQTMSDARGPKDKKSARIQGVSADFAYIGKLTIKKGRFITVEDDAGRRRTAVLDEDLAKSLFGRVEPLGNIVTIGTTPFQVVGILAKSESMLGFNESPRIYIPIQTWQVIYGKSLQMLQSSTASREKVERAMRQAVKILEVRHRGSAYGSQSMEQQMQAANQITGVLTLIIGDIAGISLFVGGIGVMNIMLVSVTERTREIGIRMALGARRRDILIQFLIEAMVLCILGGLIGMALGAGGAFLIARLAKWPPLISIWTGLLAFLFSVAIGMVFGILPANKASRLNPIEALRRE